MNQWCSHLPSTVSVVDGILGDLVDGELLHFDGTAGRASGSDSGQSTLGHDSNPRAVGVLLGELCQLLSNLDDVGCAPLVALSVGKGLGLVAESVVGVRKDAVELVLEELRYERRGERKQEGLLSQNRISEAL